VNAITVTFTINGTASNGVDYTTIMPSVFFDVGQTTATIDIAAIDDNLFEGNEERFRSPCRPASTYNRRGRVHCHRDNPGRRAGHLRGRDHADYQ